MQNFAKNFYLNTSFANTILRSLRNLSVLCVTKNLFTRPQNAASYRRYLFCRRVQLLAVDAVKVVIFR
jgi:hypothetical protein